MRGRSRYEMKTVTYAEGAVGKVSQEMYYFHVSCGGAGIAGELMARLALNLAHDARAYPLDASELLAIMDMDAGADTGGFNGLLVAELLRAAVLCELAAWDEEEVRHLRHVAGPARGAKLTLIRPKD